jgi:glycosyltransferase involved in cell wall biosynthesis
MSMVGPSVAVVLACYNQERFVGEAVKGLLDQTYPTLEIIIFDDCSTDSTAEVIRRSIAESPRRTAVQFIENPVNISGYEVSAAGLARAAGDFLMISHGDDVMMPNMIEEMMRVMIGEDVSLVTANAVYIDENSKPLNRTFRDPVQPADDSFDTLVRDGSNACSFGPAILFDRRIYETFGWIPGHLTAYDIMYPFFAYLLKGARFIRQPLLKYRVHGSNSSLSLQAEGAEQMRQLEVSERIFLGHIDHAVLMQEHLLRLASEMPERYRTVAERMLPLAASQTVEMAKKLVRTRVELDGLRRRVST